MGNPSAAQEPSMEEILASIRQIISEDSDLHLNGRDEEHDESPSSEGRAEASPQEGRAAPSEPLRVERHVAIVPVKGVSMKTSRAGANGSSAARQQTAAEPLTRETAPPSDSRLLSEGVDQAVAGSFGALAHTILAQNARTLEDLVAEMLQPMLREWLDDNLPTLVERIVQEEIQRVSRGRR